MKKNKGMIIGFLAPAVLIFLAVFLYPIVFCDRQCGFVEIRGNRKLPEIICN